MSQQSADSAKSGRAYRTIGEVSGRLDLPPHVLRFWETRFNQLRPLKRSGNRRYYRPEDVELLEAIRRMLYEDGLTIKGVQKRFREQGVKATVTAVLTCEAGQTSKGATAQDPGPGPAALVRMRQQPVEGAPSERVDEKKSLRRVLDDLRALRLMLD